MFQCWSGINLENIRLVLVLVFFSFFHTWQVPVLGTFKRLSCLSCTAIGFKSDFFLVYGRYKPDTDISQVLD